MYDPYENFESALLPNGLAVHVLHVPRPFVEVRVTVSAGALHEKVPGMAHFIEHLACRSQGRGLMELASYLDERGADFNANTSIARTRYFMKLPTVATTLSECFEMLNTICLEGRFSESSFIEERAAILREMSNPVYVAQDERERNVTRALFHGTPCAGSGTVIGTQDSVTSMELAKLQQHYRATHIPQNMHVVCVGGVTISEMVALLEKTGFAESKEGNLLRAPDALPPPAYPASRDVSVFVGPDPTVAAIAGHWSLDGSLSVGCVARTRDLINHLLKRELRERMSAVYHCAARWRRIGPYIEFFCEADDVAIPSSKLVSRSIHDTIAMASSEPVLFERQKRRSLLEIEQWDQSLEDICDDAANDIANRQRIMTARMCREEIESVTFDSVCSVVEHLNEQRAVMSFLYE